MNLTDIRKLKGMNKLISVKVQAGLVFSLPAKMATPPNNESEYFQLRWKPTGTSFSLGCVLKSKALLDVLC